MRSWASPPSSGALSSPLKKAHLLRWRPRPHAQRTASTLRVRPSGAASHLDLFERPASFSVSCQRSGTRGEGGGGLARDHLLALLILRPQLEIHEHGAIALFGRALGHYLAAARDHVAQAHEGREAHADLADGAHSKP